MVAVLVLFLVLDGFLLYRYQQSLRFVDDVDFAQRSAEADTASTEEASSSPGGESTTPEEATTASSWEEVRKPQIGVRVEGSPAWLRIVVDGQTILQRRAYLGFSQDFEANRTFSVLTDNAGAVRVEVNGRDDGRLGKSGETVSRTYTLSE